MPSSYVQAKEDARPIDKRGQGRPKGATSAKTREVANKLNNDGGVSPLEVMVENMRFFREVAMDSLEESNAIDPESCVTKKARNDAEFKKNSLMKKSNGCRMLAQQCANDAAPFMHAKIQSISLSAKDAIPIVIRMHPDDARL